MIIGERTFNSIQGKFETRFLDRVIVRGRIIPLNIYKSLGWERKVQSVKVENAFTHHIRIKYRHNRNNFIIFHISVVNRRITKK